MSGERPRVLRPYAGKNLRAIVANRSEVTTPVCNENDLASPPPRDWVGELQPGAPRRDEAIADLHALLVRASYFELNRRRGSVAAGERDDLALQAADDALVAVLAKLDTFRGASRFTTWAYKFALLEAGVKARRRAWHGREVPLDDGLLAEPRDLGPSPQRSAENAELMRALRDAVHGALTPHQREIFCALALNGVPIDVLAERLGTTRGALYKTLHDARRRLRAELATNGFAIGTTPPLGDRT
jgi:RNA polymerase sigma-70 factor (ECF subfamily)